MPDFKVRITQVLRVERAITVIQEADNAEEAAEIVSTLESPTDDDPWEIIETLEHESCLPE